jgi:hypothetical protein
MSDAPDMNLMRERQPDRRRCEVAEFEHHNIAYRASASRFEDDRLAEIFIDAGKAGTDVQNAAHDCAVAISLALQFGAPAKIILHAFEKLRDGSPAGPAGIALSKFVEGT